MFFLSFHHIKPVAAEESIVTPYRGALQVRGAAWPGESTAQPTGIKVRVSALSSYFFFYFSYFYFYSSLCSFYLFFYPSYFYFHSALSSYFFLYFSYSYFHSALSSLFLFFCFSHFFLCSALASFCYPSSIYHVSQPFACTRGYFYPCKRLFRNFIGRE